MAIDITKVKEFIKNTTDAKIMDVNHKDNTIKISNTNASDLDHIKNSGLDSVSISKNSMVFEISNEESFREFYNRWVDEEKKI